MGNPQGNGWSMKTDYELEDLSYEECIRAHGGGAANTTEPEGCDSY